MDGPICQHPTVSVKHFNATIQMHGQHILHGSLSGDLFSSLPNPNIYQAAGVIGFKGFRITKSNSEIPGVGMSEWYVTISQVMVHAQRAEAAHCRNRSQEAVRCSHRRFCCLRTSQVEKYKDLIHTRRFLGYFRRLQL